MQDILLDKESGDVVTAGGDLNIGLSDNQQQELLLMCEKGSFKENPLVGVGAQSYLEDEDKSALLNEIRRQFMADGMNINKLKVDNNIFEIDAEYTY